MDLINLIKNARPNLKMNSINAYLIILRKLNKNEKVENLNFLEKKEEIKEKIDSLKLTTSRNYLTAILVILQATGANENLINYYKNMVNDINEKYNNIMSKNKKSETQENNWLELSELKKVFFTLEKEIKLMDLKNKKQIKTTDISKFQNFLIVALYTLLPPIRLDYSPMFIVKNNKNLKDDVNYLVNYGRNKKIMIINEYKNSKNHGQQIIKIPSKLNTIINNWLFINKTEYFLLNNRGGVLSANGLGKAITQAFKPSGKHVTINLLRSIYISENVDMKAIQASEDLASQMMHSSLIQKKIYYKED